VGNIAGHTAADLNRSIQAALVAARDAAEWARRKLHHEIFGDYQLLGGKR